MHFNQSTPICPVNTASILSRCHKVVCNVQQGFRYRILLATEARRIHRQRGSGQCGSIGNDLSAASSAALGHQACHLASYLNSMAGIMESEGFPSDNSNPTLPLLTAPPGFDCSPNEHPRYILGQ
ncbi:hypothetical protein TNCV_1953371 [Trichonephila clavipes]|nr:hypothetical protein TNCV_1953371 [Trichonephila clavipes]